MEIRELRTFTTAARLRSISKAAEQLGLGQPTATTHIKKLEEELGVRLFDRIKRPIQLTSAGAVLLQRADPLLEGMDALTDDMRPSIHGGEVSVATLPDIVSHQLLNVVHAFRLMHPSVHLLLRSRRMTEAKEMVESGAVDLGVLPGLEWSPDVEFEGLFPYERVLMTPPGHPLLERESVTLEEIAQWPLILMGPSTYTRDLLESEFQRRGLRYDVVIELDSMDMIRRYVSLGMGISVGPMPALDLQSAPGVGVVRLSHLLPVEQVGIATLKRRHLALAVLDFMQALVSMRPGG